MLLVGCCCRLGEGALLRVGAEVLVSSGYGALQGMGNIGVIANPTSVLPRTMEHIVDRMHTDGQKGLLPGKLAAVFGPEHGFRGDHQAGSGGAKQVTDPQTNITVYSTYGVKTEALAPLITKSGVDGIVFDIQDVGSRYYTFIWTMYDMMCAAAKVKNGFRFVVLDRPNPLGGQVVRGPMLEEAYVSGVGKVAGIPAVHGMTVGELAKYFNENAMAKCDTSPSTNSPKVNLTVVRMEGWDPSGIFPTDQLPWVLPSPNMPTVQTAMVYPGMCFLEGSSLSEGRGTTKPFQILGAPYLSYTFSLELMNMVQTMPKKLCGVLVRETFFIPTFSKFVGNVSAGVDITVTDPVCFDPFRLVLEVLTLAKKHAPGNFSWVNGNDIDILSGSNYTRTAIDGGRPVDEILAHYEAALAKSGFQEDRKAFLLYPREDGP